MPDRTFADRRHDAAMSAIADRESAETAHLAQAAIKRCTLCDADGYRGTVICDHRPHENAGRAQKDHIRKILAKGKP